MLPFPLPFTLTSTAAPVTTAAEDHRCRCVCPPLKSIVPLDETSHVTNDTTYLNKVVYIKKNVDPEGCQCEGILDQLLPKPIVANIPDLAKFCLRCQCQYEQRNSTTQKVVIIFVIVVFGLMSIYAFFLICLDPIMNKRRKLYARQIDEMAAEEIPAHQTTSPASGKVVQAVHRVRQQQERWKGQVSVQRSNIYTEHKILA